MRCIHPHVRGLLLVTLTPQPSLAPPCPILPLPCTQYIMNQAVSRNEYWRLADKNGKPPGLSGLKPGKAVSVLIECCVPAGAEGS